MVIKTTELERSEKAVISNIILRRANRGVDALFDESPRAVAMVQKAFEGAVRKKGMAVANDNGNNVDFKRVVELTDHFFLIIAHLKKLEFTERQRELGKMIRSARGQQVN